MQKAEHSKEHLKLHFSKGHIFLCRYDGFVYLSEAKWTKEDIYYIADGWNYGFRIIKIKKNEKI